MKMSEIQCGSEPYLQPSEAGWVSQYYLWRLERNTLPYVILGKSILDFPPSNSDERLDWDWRKWKMHIVIHGRSTIKEKYNWYKKDDKIISNNNII